MVQVYKIGRALDADILLNDRSVSRDHAELVVTQEGRYRLRDTGSSFGTFLYRNGRWMPVTECTVVAEDTVMFGDHEVVLDRLIGTIVRRQNTIRASTSGLQPNIARRHATVMAADIVGYSRMMEREESRTLARLKLVYQQHIDPNLRRFNGRLVKTTGDGFLAEFTSSAGAVRCAVRIQREMANRNAVRPRERHMVFRIGINAGDVIVDGDDIFGTGVNIAARLEGVAAPGGIALSAPVVKRVRGRLTLPFEDRGYQTLKNIVEPVRVYDLFVTVQRDRV